MADELDASLVRGKITLLPGYDAELTSVTFCIMEEDHTIGNALRYMLMKELASYDYTFKLSRYLRVMGLQSMEFFVYEDVQAMLSIDIKCITCFWHYTNAWNSPRVEFCGYTLPHPSENKIHMRVQVLAVTAMRDALENLDQLFASINELYNTSLATSGVEREPASTTNIPLRTEFSA